MTQRSGYDFLAQPDSQIKQRPLRKLRQNALGGKPSERKKQAEQGEAPDHSKARVLAASQCAVEEG